MEKRIIKDLNVLNDLASRLITEEDNSVIIKNIVEESIKIIKSDYGFAYGKLNGSKKYNIIYKSRSAPSNPTLPTPEMRLGNASIIQTKKLVFDSDVKKINYKSPLDIYLKSYILVPISYGDHLYGNIVFGYKKPHHFSEGEQLIASTAGNIVSYLVTINWLIENERKARSVAEKQKEIELLLSEEKRKTEFIADAAHEFRTPLAIIRGNIDLAMLKGVNDPKYIKKVFKDINHEIEHLSELISDLTLVASGSTRSYKAVRYKKIDLSQLVNRAANSLQKIAYKKNISIKVKSIPEVQIIGDDIYIEKMFRNIIRNAITYSKEGGLIEISGSKDKSLVKISVKDSGIGIPKEDLQNIFRRFFKAENSKEAKKGGVGLGLSIAKKVAEDHGGDISVKSTLGKGSVFTVSLPLIKN